jgi:hypothetical protein
MEGAVEMRVEGDATQIAESDSLSLNEHSERLAAAVAGSFSVAQVYFSGPDAWIAPTIFVRLYGRRGGGRLLLSEVPLATTAYTSEDGKSTALAISVSGVHVDGFEVVVAQDDDAGVLVTDGRILLVVAPGGTAADIRPAAPPVLQPKVAQGAAAGLSGRWPVFLSDGATEVGSVTNALHVRKSDRRAAFYLSTEVGTAIDAVTDQLALYLWNDATGKRAEIRRITIAYLAGVGGTLTVKGAHVTGLPGAGVTAIDPLPLDPGDGATSEMVGGSGKVPVNDAVDSPLLFFSVPFSATGTFVWTWTDLGKPIVLPAGAQHGFAIRFDVNARATVEMKLHVSIEWLEV